jgi:hypothetical protein
VVTLVRLAPAINNAGNSHFSFNRIHNSDVKF